MLKRFFTKNKVFVPIPIQLVKSENNCGICLDDIIPNKNFGLLCCCQHIFCFPCIYEWRKQSLLCPICKIDSKILINSPIFTTCCNKDEIINSNPRKSLIVLNIVI